MMAITLDMQHDMMAAETDLNKVFHAQTMQTAEKRKLSHLWNGGLVLGGM
jgi:hypothetical protein